jgi:hypothetical protein
MKVKTIQWLRREVKEVALRLNINYDVFSVTADGITMAVYMELSDQPEQCIKDIVIDAIKRKFGRKPDNINETYKMFIKAWPGDTDHSIIQMR